MTDFDTNQADHNGPCGCCGKDFRYVQKTSLLNKNSLDHLSPVIEAFRCLVEADRRFASGKIRSGLNSKSLLGEGMNEQVKIQDQCHQAEQKGKADVGGTDHYSFARSATCEGFSHQKDHVTAVEHRNWQEIQDRQVHTQESQE